MTQALASSPFFSAARALPEMLAVDHFLSSRRTRRHDRGVAQNAGLSAAAAAAAAPRVATAAAPALGVLAGAAPGGAARRLRVALYSHDTLGLGHLRRNLLIAEKLATGPLQATVLLISGTHEANFFQLPPGVDCVTLPRLQKGADGSYAAGRLAISLNDLVRLRAEAIVSSLEAFAPDLLVVDKVPSGAFGELLPTLRFCQTANSVQCVLGVRDVLDDVDSVRREWQEADSENVVDQFYDQVWVYGDKRVFDPVHEYAWSSRIAQRVRFTGYLDQRERAVDSAQDLATILESTVASESADSPRRQWPLAVCTLGGGKDGFAVAENFLAAAGGVEVRGVLLTGPFMHKEQFARLQRLASSHDNLAIVDFTPAADQLVRIADRVVAMAGYNTVCSILSYNRPSLLIPRVAPRQEQSIRAERLQRLGLVDVLHATQMTTAAVRQWLLAPTPVRRPRETIDLCGLDRVEQFAGRLVSAVSASRLQPRPEAL